MGFRARELLVVFFRGFLRGIFLDLIFWMLNCDYSKSATLRNLGCPAGFFDLGTMGSSKHDSIDNSDSFHLQSIKNCSDHF